MLTRQKFIERINNIDWGYFDKDYPAIAFLLRCSEDYGYIEQIAEGKITSANDIRMKATAELIKKGIEFVPIVGDILSMISNLIGIDLTAFKSISDSGTARQRLFEWIGWINNNYTSEKSGLPPLNDMNARFIKATQLLINARPKCQSTTENCSKEHARYIVRTSLLKEAQQNIYSIYYNYCLNDFTFNQWLIGMKQGSQSGSGNIPETKSSLALPLLLLGGLLFSKKI